MTVTKQEYFEAKAIVDRYEEQENKKPERSFIAGDGVLIKEKDTYFAVAFSNPEMNIVSSIIECIFPKDAGWYEQSYRCFSTKENAKSFIIEKGFIVKI